MVNSAASIRDHLNVMHIATFNGHNDLHNYMKKLYRGYVGKRVLNKKFNNFIFKVHDDDIVGLVDHFKSYYMNHVLTVAEAIETGSWRRYTILTNKAGRVYTFNDIDWHLSEFKRMVNTCEKGKKAILYRSYW